MKKTLKMTAALFAAVVTLTLCATGVLAGTKVMAVATNLRTKPSMSGAVQLVIPKNAYVSTGNQHGKWTYVQYQSGAKKHGGYVWTANMRSPSGSTSLKRQLATAIWLRKGPGINYGKIRAIEGGETVTLLAEAGSWYKVRYAGRNGYIKSGYFVGETSVRQMVTAVYLRSGPSTSYRAKTVIPTNGKVTVLAQVSSKWYRVRYKGTTGYVTAGYFKTDGYNTSSKRIVKTTIFIRSSMDVSSRANVIAWVPANGEVTVLSQPTSRWYRVSYRGKTGYMRAGYFR